MTIDDRILELVKKYLADVAPNSMTAAEIHYKLKEDGIPATQSFAALSFAALFLGLLDKWVSEGIIVCVGRGVFKLADN